MSSYHVDFQSYGHQNIRNDSFFVFSADDSKKSVTIWEKHLAAPERSFLFLSENGMVLGFGVTVYEISRIKV